MNRKRTILLAGAAAVTSGLLLASCSSGGNDGLPGSSQQLRDLKNVSVTEPDKVRMVVNVDKYPNIVGMCIAGAGFATTTRAAAGAMLRVEKWDAPGGWCGQ